MGKDKASCRSVAGTAEQFRSVPTAAGCRSHISRGFADAFKCVGRLLLTRSQGWSRLRGSVGAAAKPASTENLGSDKVEPPGNYWGLAALDPSHPNQFSDLANHYDLGGT